MVWFLVTSPWQSRLGEQILTNNITRHLSFPPPPPIIERQCSASPKTLSHTAFQPEVSYYGRKRHYDFWFMLTLRGKERERESERESLPGECGGGVHISTTPWPSLTDTAPLARVLKTPRSVETHTHTHAGCWKVAERHSVAERVEITCRLRVKHCIWAWLMSARGLTRFSICHRSCGPPVASAQAPNYLLKLTSKHWQERRPSGN